MLRSEVKNGTLYIIPEGKIDTNNAQVFQRETEKIVEENPGLPVTIDADNLIYISSAGLRVMLAFMKKNLKVSVINANPVVYEIFDSTGFSEMMEVKKAYKRISIDGCEVIGRGSNALIYRLDSETIVKVYFDSDSLSHIQNERSLARYAFVHELPTAISYDIVRVKDTYGSVFELLNARSLSRLIMDEPGKMSEYIGEFVSLLKIIHEKESMPGDVPSIKQTYLRYAGFLKDYLPEKSYLKLYNLISAVPEDYHLIHGDYYTNNVMIQDGNPILVDLDTLSCGDPIFEFASTFNAYCGFPSIYDYEEDSGRMKGELALEVWNEILKQYYSEFSDKERQLQEDRSALLGYARILRRHIRRLGSDTEEKKRQYNKCRDILIDFIEKIDSLA